jgi:two-component system response regulator CpxR
MSVISIFSATFTNEQKYIAAIENSFEFKLLRDTDIISKAAELSDISAEKIENILRGNIPIFNKFSKEKERTIAALNVELSKIIARGNILLDGQLGLLLPKAISHILFICLTADKKSRIENAIRSGIDDDEAQKQIKEADIGIAKWIKEITGSDDPWDTKLYDILAPTNQTTPDELIAMIKKSVGVLSVTEQSKKAQSEFALAAKVQWELIQNGHFVDVACHGGKIIITINKNVLMLSKLKSELKGIVENIEGVESVETKIGKSFHQSDIYSSYNFELPDKVLLVDDEREFVQTLSERLMLREMGSVVAYDGQSALDIIDSDEPEVMILDLQMPGIDGIEVLRKVKAAGSKVEVIILTGHGSEEDRETCMKLGAFAYLHKPVNIDLLSNTIRDAYKKLNIIDNGSQ